MNTNRTTIMHVEKHRGQFSVSFLCLLMTLLLMVKISNGANTTNISDTSKKQFDLNDPRNPNCPCHKYQKIADDEYREQLKKENKNNGRTGSAHATLENRMAKQNTGSSMKHRHKKQSNHYYKKNNGCFKKYWKNFRSKKDPSSCFHW